MFPMNKLKVIFLCFAFLSCEKVQETTIPLTRVYLEIDFRIDDCYGVGCHAVSGKMDGEGTVSLRA